MFDADLIIIGAGPAGMAAAVTAANEGVKVLLLDEQPQAGGQIYRNVKNQNDKQTYLGKDYSEGCKLVDALDHENIKTEFSTSVWRIEDDLRVVWSQNGISNISSAQHVLLATGAQERVVPFPGWTLPGVMTAGSAQILMKTSGLLPKDAVLAGSGPLLYLIAAQMIDAGTPPKVLVETQSFKMMLRAARHLPHALFDSSTLFKGFNLLRKIKTAGIKRYKCASDFRAEALENGDLDFSFECKGRKQHLNTTLLLTHQGVVPSTHLSRASGIDHEWNKIQKALQPMSNIWGETNKKGFHVTGDGSGIGGAEAAKTSGRLAALNILYRLGHLSEDGRNKKAKKDRKALNRSLSIRPLLDTLYAPLPEFLSPPDETIVCRCEEVTAAEIRQSISEGATGHRQIKTSLRNGMGPCQGRMCDLTVRGLLVDSGVNPDLPRARTPIKPIKLGELANLEINKK